MTWHDLDAKRKTWIFLAVAGVIALWLLWPAAPPQPRRILVQPPVQRVPIAPQAPQLNRALGPGAAPDPLQELLGYFQGREVLPDGRGLCDVHLEIVRGKGGKDAITAYSRMVCQPLLHGRPVQVSNPTAAVLSGSAVNGGLHLAAQSNIGVRDALHGCDITTLSVASGGTNTINVEWQEATEATGVCRGAQMQMRRVGR
jgi:hypothetical protein